LRRIGKLNGIFAPSPGGHPSPASMAAPPAPRGS
jgi:hypothetical protein